MTIGATPVHDPRSIITPDALSVDPSLFGTPLSGPGRRFWALTLDGIAVLMITAMTSSFWYVLPFIIGFFFLSRALQKGTGRFAGMRRFSFGCLGFMVLLVSVAVIFSVRWLDENDGEEFVQELLEARERTEVPGLDFDPVADLPSDEGFGPWLRGKLDTLSFGLGWWTMYFAILMPWMKGSTPGKRIMGIRVVRLDGQPITWWHAFERAGGYAAGLATGLLGFVQIYWDPNRQGIHDKVAGTVVILDGAQRVPGQWEQVVAAEQARNSDPTPQ
jgi:RDD family protein